jgi:hypothetical protein
VRALDREKAGANGIILAGGKSTRLGPLAAQISKALVTVDNRPQVVNQIMQLREAGCTNIIVVVSRSTYDQTNALLQRCGMNVTVVADGFEQGPVRGIMVGLETQQVDHNCPTYVMFSDAVIDEPLYDNDSSWIGVTGDYDANRSWCYIGGDGVYRDGVPQSFDYVTIGVYHFADTRVLHNVAAGVMYELREKAQYLPIQMAPLLNLYTTMEYSTRTRLFTTWRDVGDIFSLAAARHRKFNGRAKHALMLDKHGVLHKTGVSDAEIDFYDHLGERDISVQTLFPTHYSTDRALHQYSMEYVDLPTLAELWLYWPGLPATWAGIVSSLVERLIHTLWLDRKDETNNEFTAGDWMASKAIERLNLYNPAHELEEMIWKLGDIVGEDIWVAGHGDLNFTNIMYSINTGNFKLIDPRGGEIPLIYELGKLAYSHVFSAVTHGLFIELDPKSWILPQRKDEYRAIIDVLLQYVEEERLTATMALILLSAPPLHSPSEGRVLLDLGVSMAKDLL